MFRWYIFISLLLFASACFRTGEVENDDVCISEASSRTITYSADIAPMFTENCTQCHGGSVSNGATEPLTSQSEVNGQYSTIRDYVKRPLADSKHMPIGYRLEDCQIYIIDKYQTDGFQ